MAIWLNFKSLRVFNGVPFPIFRFESSKEEDVELNQMTSEIISEQQQQESWRKKKKKIVGAKFYCQRFSSLLHKIDRIFVILHSGKALNVQKIVHRFMPKA